MPLDLSQIGKILKTVTYWKTAGTWPGPITCQNLGYSCAVFEGLEEEQENSHGLMVEAK